MNLSQTIDLFCYGTSSGAKKAWDTIGRKTNKLQYNADKKSWEHEDGSPLPGHLKGLRIPPAWKNVEYDPNPNASLLVKGQDVKGRTQSLYSEKFVKAQADAKFARIKELDAKFDKLQKEVKTDARNGNEEAAVLSLIMNTGIRPGSEQETGGAKKAYGATTLRTYHVTGDDEDNVRLKFVGKKGVNISVKVTDPEIARDLLYRRGSAEQRGPIFNTSASKLLDYTHSKDGGGFKTKDFRTLLGTRIATKLVESMKAPKTMKDYKKKVRDVADKVAKQLGNTRTVALQSYIHPAVFAKWRPNEQDS